MCFFKETPFIEMIPTLLLWSGIILWCAGYGWTGFTFFFLGWILACLKP